jgi:hypothetical protein
MDALFQALANPGSMTSQQWQLLALMLLAVLGIIYLTWRLYKVVAGDQRKQPYALNLGRKRTDAAQSEQEKK